MPRMLSGTLLVSLFVLGLADPAPAQELLTNPGFETWPLVNWHYTRDGVL